ncbi:MAG: 50S ribosomal protein L11 methyltransferase [Chloroflexi bacterium]|nr:MAG: 50S ribosomal protein L11 methyltransferase [Chloroflexota bacterium]
MEEWLEVGVTTENEAAEAVAEVLSRYAHRGVVIAAGPEGWNAGPVTVRAYLPVNDQLRTHRRHIEEALGHLNQICPVSAPTFRPVAEADWAEAWKERLTVFRVGRNIVIQPSWQDYTPACEDVVIRLDPGMAFGTGLHPTTQMCLEALEESLHSGGEVLDLGTGSGILAIAAAKLGAGRVLAVDNDPSAVKIARENVVVNGVEGVVSTRCGSLDEVAGSYDLVLVNILAKVIVDMTHAGLATRVRSGGRLIAAGILAEQEPEVATAVGQGGFTLVERRQREDWICLVAERGYSSASD